MSSDGISSLTVPPREIRASISQHAYNHQLPDSHMRTLSLFRAIMKDGLEIWDLAVVIVVEKEKERRKNELPFHRMPLSS